MKIVRSVISAVVLLGVAVQPSLAYLATNGSFETEGAQRAEAYAWSKDGSMFRESYAADTGEFSDFAAIAPGWESNGNFWQTINCDSNLSYYFRVRALRETNFTNANVYVITRFYPPGTDWTVLQSYTNQIPIGLTAYTWTTYEAGGPAPDGAGKVQMRLAYSDSVNAGNAMRFDHAALYTGGKNYRSGEIVDEFSYSPTITDASSWVYQDVAGGNRGNGFSGDWTGLWGSIFSSASSFGVVSNYPAPQGNKMHIPWEGGGILRAIPAISTGTVYFATYFNYSNEDQGHWAGMSLYDAGGGDERAFVGANSGGIGQTKMKVSLDAFGGALTQGSYDFNAGAGQDYLIFGKYDFATRQLSAHAFYKTDTIPWDEEPSWQVTATLGVGRIAEIDAIRLAAGGDGDSNPGDVYFDELRVSDTWWGLFNRDEPPPMGTLITVR